MHKHYHLARSVTEWTVLMNLPSYFSFQQSGALRCLVSPLRLCTDQLSLLIHINGVSPSRQWGRQRSTLWQNNSRSFCKKLKLAQVSLLCSAACKSLHWQIKDTQVLIFGRSQVSPIFLLFIYKQLNRIVATHAHLWSQVTFFDGINQA